MKLKTEGYFDASHHLEGYEGICSRAHGHRWKVEVGVQGHIRCLDDVGILWDFNNLDSILERYDHQDLNEVLEYNPTAENISLDILKELKEKDPQLFFKVRVYESPTSFVEVEK